MMRENIENRRFFLKDTVRMMTDFSSTGQSMGMPAPPLQKPYPEDARLISLPKGDDALRTSANMPLWEAVGNRESVRDYSPKPMSMQQLSALLWATQGVKQVLDASCALRTVPSAGARHAFETYLAVDNVETLPPGLYRFLPFDNKLLALREDREIGEKAAYACLGQGFVANAAVTFFWTAMPERMEWRYGMAAHKVIAVDVGHLCQNLYLAATAMGTGACAIAAYDQAECDDLLGVDGEDEFTVYVCAVGNR